MAELVDLAVRSIATSRRWIQGNVVTIVAQLKAAGPAIAATAAAERMVKETAAVAAGKRALGLRAQLFVVANIVARRWALAAPACN